MVVGENPLNRNGEIPSNIGMWYGLVPIEKLGSSLENGIVLRTIWIYIVIRAMQDYCDKEKKLFSIVIPEED